MHRALAISDPDRRPIAGDIAVTDNECNWRFTPSADWLPGRYELVIDRVLEDVAGNSVGRPFEVDEASRPINADDPPVRRAFDIR